MNKIMVNCAYFYIMLPIVIFLCGWCSWYIAIPGTIVFIAAFFRICKSNQQMFCLKWNKKEIVKFLIIGAIICLWVYLSGIGKFVYQNWDHIWRNALFDILVEYDWPVVEEMLMDGEMQSRGLIYYIGFWLPSAVIGKAFGLQIGYFAQYVWAVLGIIIFYYLICVIRKKVEIWPLILFIFMSGLDFVGYIVTGNDMALIDGTSHIEWWTVVQFSSFTTQLFWVFNQALPAWIIFVLMYLQKNNKYIVLLFGCTLLSSTLPFVGLFPFFIYFIFSRKYEKNNYGKFGWWISFLKDTFTFENILGGGIAGILSFLYLSSNSSGQNIRIDDSLPGLMTMQEKVMMVFIFLVLEAGLYWVVVYKYQKKNPLFYIMIAWLCICPWIQVGYAGDFCMRASIPALVLLYIMLVEAIENFVKAKKYIQVCLIVLLICLGAITSKNEIQRTIVNTYRDGVNGERVTNEEIFTGSNFSGDVKDSVFFNYISKYH